ncbi:MAG: DUF1893 domain-containing protein [Spirochaetia bacterium]|jgi:zinc transport system ATP-binding protein|nr:DUF1893 domain-containing protein [Spirochaetia bacterium]
MDLYLQNLPEGKTLCVCEDDKLIFSSSGKWLHPLFELERFLSKQQPAGTLSAHDTAGGKAAAALMVRMGIKKVKFNLISKPAESFLENHGIAYSYDRQVERLACMTETLLQDIDDLDEIYRLLRRKAKLVDGVIVKAEHLCLSFGPKKVLRDLNLEIGAGEPLLIIGENGAGKTTLLKILLGQLQPDSGSLLIDGKLMKNLPSRMIGYIKQGTTAESFPMSVREVVEMGVDPTLSQEEKKFLIDTSLRRCGVAALTKRNYFSLSGGEQQKVSIARCLCQGARLLLLDEPTSYLDESGRSELVSLLQALTLDTMPTILCVSHDRQFQEELGWRTFRLEAPDA